jgi:hypothetical protein
MQTMNSFQETPATADVPAAAAYATAFHCRVTWAAAAPLEADRQVVCLFSSVARGLPEADEWDLSGLLVDGQPVSRATAVAWLNAAYQAAYAEDFDAQPPDEDAARSVKGLYQLLSFADAVDSTKPVLNACCAQLKQLKLHAQLRQQQLALDTDGAAYYFGADTQRLVRQPDTSTRGSYVEDDPTAVTAEEQRAFKQQVAAQTEQLLWLAYKLQLQPLVLHMHHFIRTLSCFRNSLLRDADAVSTPRVLEAAGVANLPDGKQLLVNSVVGEVLQLSDIAVTELSDEQRQPLMFNAVLQSSSLRFLQGAAQHAVPVELDLFGSSTIRVGISSYNVQLRIGPHHAAPKKDA